MEAEFPEAGTLPGNSPRLERRASQYPLAKVVSRLCKRGGPHHHTDPLYDALPIPRNPFSELTFHTIPSCMHRTGLQTFVQSNVQDLPMSVGSICEMLQSAVLQLLDCSRIRETYLRSATSEVHSVHIHDGLHTLIVMPFRCSARHR